MFIQTVDTYPEAIYSIF